MAYSNSMFMHHAQVGVNESSTPVTDMSPHVDGGMVVSGTNATAGVSSTANLHMASGIVIAAVVLLWALGAIVFSDVKL